MLISNFNANDRCLYLRARNFLFEKDVISTCFLQNKLKVTHIKARSLCEDISKCSGVHAEFYEHGGILLRMIESPKVIKIYAAAEIIEWQKIKELAKYIEEVSETLDYDWREQYEK